MEDKFFEKILDQVIEEAAPIYLENELKDDINDEDIVFSDIHEAKMKKLFKEMKAKENRAKLLRVTKRVAVILICFIAIMVGLISTVDAWREKVVKFIMKNNADNYMSISFGESSGDEEDENSGDSIDTKTANTYITDEVQFLYLPEGFEINSEKIVEKSKNFIFWNHDSNKFINFKKELLNEIFGKEIDIENSYSEKFIFNDKEVFKTLKENNRTTYMWYDDKTVYSVYSNLEKEDEILKIIENIKIFKEI